MEKTDSVLGDRVLSGVLAEVGLALAKARTAGPDTDLYDFAHRAGAFADAAACYALMAAITLRIAERDRSSFPEVFGPGGPPAPKTWPFDAGAWNSAMPRENLITAAAFLVNEILRFDRSGLGVARVSS